MIKGYYQLLTLSARRNVVIKPPRFKNNPPTMLYLAGVLCNFRQPASGKRPVMATFLVLPRHPQLLHSTTYSTRTA
jgi:hypothetical protein